MFAALLFVAILTSGHTASLMRLSTQEMIEAESSDTCKLCSCSKDEDYGGIDVDCWGLDLTSAPTTYPAWTTSLALGGNKITSLQKTQFDSLIHLKSLDIGTNALTELPHGVFQALKGLKNLYLDHNKIGKVCQGHFKQLTQLQYLGLNNNLLKSIPDTVFDAQGQVSELSLQNNQLSSIPVGLFSKTKKLQAVNLSGNPLSCSCSLFENLVRIEDKTGICDKKVDLGIMKKENRKKFCDK